MKKHAFVIFLVFIVFYSRPSLAQIAYNDEGFLRHAGEQIGTAIQCGEAKNITAAAQKKLNEYIVGKYPAPEQTGYYKKLLTNNVEKYQKMPIATERGKFCLEARGEARYMADYGGEKYLKFIQKMDAEFLEKLPHKN